MPNYKVVDSDKLNSDITIVADAIRAKSGSTESLVFPDGMKTAIENIVAGSGGFYLKSENESGGLSYQFTAEELKLGTLEVTENGTYKASEHSAGGTQGVNFTQDSEFNITVAGMNAMNVAANLPNVDIESGNFEPLKSGWSYKLASGMVNIDIKAEDLAGVELLEIEGGNKIGIVFLYDAPTLTIISSAGGAVMLAHFIPPNYEEYLVNSGMSEEDIQYILSEFQPNHIVLNDVSAFGITGYEVSFEYVTAGEPVDGFSEVVVNVPIDRGPDITLTNGVLSIN
jgi:hypothetical protein